jgi:hypothetical protein
LDDVDGVARGDGTSPNKESNKFAFDVDGEGAAAAAGGGFEVVGALRGTIKRVR